MLKDSRLQAIAIAGLLFITIVFMLTVSVLVKNNNNNKTEATKPASSSVSDVCAQNQNYNCYKKELTGIVNNQSPEKALSLVQQSYPTVAYAKSYCHQLTHIVGRAAYLKYKDLAVTYVHGNHFCASGYFHGASEEIVTEKGADYIINNANSICASFAKKDRYSLNHYNCVHGLGHGFMEALEGDLFASLKACDSLPDTWEQQSCYSGVFMQNIMIAESPDESEDHSSKFLKKDDVMYPCNTVEQKYREGCYIIQTSWALPQLNNDYSKVFELCSQVDLSSLQDICYQSLGRDASGLQGYDSRKTTATCLLGQTEQAQQGCVVGAAKDIVYNFHDDKQAYEFCATLPQSLSDYCKGVVKNNYDYYFKKP